MKYNNRLYPYPVLGISDDIKGQFQVDLKYSSDGKVIKVNPTFRLSNTSLEEMIKDKRALFVTHLYCRGTMFRDVFVSTDNIPDAITIAAPKLNGEVEVDFFICSVKEERYRNSLVNTDYSDYSFPIEKADIIAYGGKGKFYANKTYEDLKAVSALMLIDESHHASHAMKNSYEGDKITILLCKEDYQKYKLVKNIGTEMYINVLHSTIVLPALLEALYFLDDKELSNNYSEYRWHIVLSEIKNKSQDNNFTIAQNILDLPNNRLFESLIKNSEDYE